MDTVCCVRCGARTAKVEKNCQQCGASNVAPSASEAVIGACYHCGASWRGGWLFCRTCGIDRDHALMAPASMPAGPTPSRDANPFRAEESLEITKVFCKRCGALAKPFSRYCETCGNTLDLSKAVPPKEPAKDEPFADEADRGMITGKLSATPLVTAAFRTQADLSTGGSQTSISSRSQSSYDPLAVADRAGRKAAPANDSLAVDYRAGAGAARGKSPAPNSKRLRKTSNATASTGTERMVQRSDSRGALLVWIIIVGLGVSAGYVAWRLWTTQKNLMRSPGSSSGRAPEQSLQPSPAPPTGENSKPIAAPEGMVFVSGGTFKMGRDDGDDLERPAHVVEVKPFFIDRNEVTNEEYRRFILATKRRPPAHWIGGKIPDGQMKLPVVNVSWSDANAYARWANKRLPTEAEWEFAARGADGRVYPWGNAWRPGYANAGQGSKGRISEAGSYTAGASPFGALDMSGNVWEWTASDFNDYPGRQAPSALASSGLKVIRGGAYDAPPKNATATYRGAVSPDRVYDKTGFRCARDAK